jgi:transcriptional regulator with XRE-family HTH domain
VSRDSRGLHDPDSDSTENRDVRKPEEPPDWYLREWAAERGKRQADLVRDLGWLKGRASKVWNGSIPYRRELVDEISTWLGIRPYELLMPPRDALALRRLRETAAEIVAENDQPFIGTPPAPAPPARRVGRR